MSPLHDLDATWEYRTATGWSTTLADAEPVLSDGDDLSTQLSVVPDGAGWALVSQEPLGSDVNVWRSAELGPGATPEVLTTLPPAPGGRTYNALVHPEMTNGAELLISYNVIALDDAANLLSAELYRPRFVRATLP